MKKILFTIADFERGGIPRVLLNLIHHIDQKEYDISLFCGNQRGIYLTRIPSNCHLLKKNLLLQALMCNYRKERFPLKLFALIIKFVRKFFLIIHYDILDSINNHIKSSLAKQKFDIIWACSEGLPSQWVPQNPTAKKIIWLHNNYDWNAARGDLIFATDFSFFDVIVCVSKNTKKSFLNVYPILKNKTFVLYNLLDENEIIQLAEKTLPKETYKTNLFTILSVGRFSYQKQFEAIPAIARKLLNQGCSFRWYIIGNGGKTETKLITNAIKNKNVAGTVILLGEQSNPYSFMKRASILALTSRYESYPTVINEAKFLQIPIISTNFSGVEEILDQRYGIIAPIEEFAGRLECYIKQPKLLEPYKQEKFIPQKNKIMKKFYKIIRF